MKRNERTFLKRTVGLVLASVLCLTQSIEEGTVASLAAGIDEAYTPELLEAEQTYVPGEVLVCLMPEVYEAYKNKEDSAEALYGDDGILPLGAGELLDMGKDLMDVSNAVNNLDLVGESGYAFPSPEDSDSVDPDTALDKTAVIRLIHSDEYSTEELISIYTDIPGVICVEPNYINGITDTFSTEENASENEPEESDPVPVTGIYPDLTGLQYAYGADNGGMEVPGWNSSAVEGESNENATGVVAVLDTGVDVTNPDLCDVMWDEGDSPKYAGLAEYGGGKYGFNSGAEYTLTDTTDVSDHKGHGTHLAGIVAAAWNDYGISGIANGVKIMAVNHSIDNEGHSYESTTVSGMAYIDAAKELGVNIVSVNCSFGGPYMNLIQYLVVKELEEAGIVVVYASGNENENIDLKPDTSIMFNESAGVITVDASTQSYSRASFSNYGIRNTHIFAPGMDILSTYPLELAGAFPDRRYSSPVTDADEALVLDEFDNKDTYFTYEENELNGSVKTIEDGVLKIKGTKLAKDDRDEVTEATAPGDTLNGVMLTMSAPKPLPKPADGGKYTLMLRVAGSDADMYAKVYVKTVEGTWARPGYTPALDTEFANNSYVLDKCLNGEEVDLDNLQIRIVMDTRRTECEAISEFDIDSVWITAADVMPFAYDRGTSMSAPAVAGEIAILAKAFPNDSAAKRAARVLAGAVKHDDLSGRCITGGIANVKNSLDEASYTPVINSVSDGDDGNLLIRGYFFGACDDTSITIRQGDSVWSSLKGDFEISEVKKQNAASEEGSPGTPPEDSETIVISYPEGLKAGDVSIGITDSKKPAGRNSFTRILNYNAGTVDGRIDIPDDTSPEVYYELLAPKDVVITGLKNKLYFTGRNQITNTYETPVYDIDKDTWSMCKASLIINDPLKNVAWREQLLYIDQMSGSVYLVYADPDTGITEIRILDSGNEDLSDSYLALYYDGVNMYLFRTPQAINEDDMPVATGVTQVWELDPVLGTASYIGDLQGQYMNCIITHAEEKKDGKTTRTVYLTGFDEAVGSNKLISESFVMPDNTEDFVSYYKDITPEGGFEIVSSPNGLSGCALPYGVFLTGICKADENPDTGVVEITADSFVYQYETGKLLPKNIYSRILYQSSSVVYGGKLYVYGVPADGTGEPLFFARDIEDAFTDYGDIPFVTTDRNVRVKKLAFDKKAYSFNRGYITKLEPDVTFAEEGKTTGFEFESSNPYSVRIHPETGQMIASETGSSIITVRCGDKTAKCSVNVGADDFIPEGLNKTTSELRVGEMDYLTLTECYQTGKETLKWSSSDKKTVSVNNGLITAKKEGTATVTAIRKCGKNVQKFECKVTVTGINVPKEQAPDKAVKLSVNKSSLKVNSMEAVTLNIALKGNGAANRFLKVTTLNPDVAVFSNAEDAVLISPKAVTGKTGQTQASIDIYGNRPGSTYVIVESYEGSPEDMNENTPVNRKLVRISVSAPASEITVDYDSTVRSYVWEVPDDWQMPDEGEAVALTLYKGAVDSLYCDVAPQICTDAAGIKWSVKGSGVSVKNGVVTAKSVTKKNKKGEYQPAIVTARCGKATCNVYVFVVE